MKKILRKIISRLGYTLQKNRAGIAKNKFWDGKLPVDKRFTPFEITFLDKKLYVHDRASFLLGYKELFVGDIYRFKAATDTPYIIDCGANLGMSIIYFKQLYPKAIITAFEADSTIFSYLKRNVASFAFTQVELFNKAVWDTDHEKLSFFSEGGAGGRVEVNTTVSSTFTETFRLKNLLNRPVDFLKLDIEGAEARVITDCERELKNVRTMFIEYHSFDDSEQKLDEILKTIKLAGFKYHIKEAYTTSRPFIDKKLNGKMDLQLNIFCYRN